MNPKLEKQSKPVMAFILIAGTVAMEVVMLFKEFIAGLRNSSQAIIIELVALAIIAAFAIYLTFSKGLDSKLKLAVAGILFAIYIYWSVVNFEIFYPMFAANFKGYYAKYYGMAVQSGKLFVIALGMIAAIPTVPQLQAEDYIRGTESLIKRTQEERAARFTEEAAKTSTASIETQTEADAARTLERLKASLGEEEFERLLADIAAKDKLKEEAANKPDTYSVNADES